jgi:hypothetical protein
MIYALLRLAVPINQIGNTITMTLITAAFVRRFFYSILSDAEPIIYRLVTIVMQYHQKILDMYKIAVEDTLTYEQIWVIF